MGRIETVTQSFEAAREWAQPRIEAGIEKNRKADNIIEITDKNGNPVSGVTLRYRLKRHAFLHGANCFMLDELETPEKNERYRELFAGVFNQATLPFYWSDLEPERGKPRFDRDSPKIYRRPAPDLCLDYCDRYNVVPKLHCLNYDQWSPMWLPTHDVPEVKRELERRISEIAARYADKIRCMEVINETLCGFVTASDRHSTDFFWADDLISWSFQTARKYLPGNELVINEATGRAWDVSHGERSWYALSILDAIRRGAEIDAIGLQFHMFHRLENEVTQTLPFYDPAYLFKSMDFYDAHFGLPLQVTEVTIPAYSNSAEDEEAQARVIENLYSIWFSHPAVEAVTYWNLVDGYAAFAAQGDMASGENYYHGGLVRFDFTPKPAYYMLQELFGHRWHSEGMVKTGADGRAALRGFKGDYEITAERNGQSCPLACTLNGGSVTLALG